MHDGSQNLSRSRLVYKDVSSRLAGLADEWQFTESLLHQPFELVSQETINQEDVEGTLMIGYEYVGSIFPYIRVPLHPDGEQE